MFVEVCSLVQSSYLDEGETPILKDQRYIQYTCIRYRPTHAPCSLSHTHTRTHSHTHERNIRTRAQFFLLIISSENEVKDKVIFNTRNTCMLSSVHENLIFFYIKIVFHFLSSMSLHQFPLKILFYS